jgi:hypothetical protein
MAPASGLEWVEGLHMSSVLGTVRWGRRGLVALAVVALGVSGCPTMGAAAAPGAAVPECTITGTAHGDVLSGTAGADVICGLGGNDRLLGGGGNDSLLGGGGRDVLVGGAGGDLLLGGPGDDVVQGGTGDDSLWGGTGDDTVQGGPGADRMRGSGGSDSLSGGAGGDVVTYPLRVVALRLSIGDGANDGTRGEGDEITADVEDLRGGMGNDTIVGSNAGNRLFGLGGNDRLVGGRGNDGLSGGTGTDVVDGRDGARFVDDLSCGDGAGDRVLADMTDQIGAGCEDVVQNDAPTDITLTPASVLENATVGTTVGALMATDPDPADDHTFTLVTGSGDTDNGSFTIAGSQLRTAAVFDFETKNSYSVRVRTSDGEAAFAKALTVTIVDGQEPPTLQPPPPATTAEDTPVTVTLRAADPEGQDVVSFVTSAASHGSVGAVGPITCTGTPKLCSADVEFTPDADYNGPAGFSYTASDGAATSGPAAVAITVDPVNDAPVAVDGSRTTDEDTAVALNLAGLVSDVETADAGFTYTIVTTPAHGTATATTYTPDQDFNGADSFTYQVTDRGDPDNCGAPAAGCDGPETSSIQTVSITVNPVNDTPAAPDASRTTDEDVPLAVDLAALAADVETADADLTFSVTQPAHGTVTGTGGSRTYTPTADFNGTDSFTYQVTDRGDPDNCGAPGPACDDTSSATGTITVTVDAVNDAPVNTVPASVRAEDTPVALNLAALVSDVETADADLTYTIVTGPAHGDATATTYTPDQDFNGADSLTFQVTDRGDPDNCGAPGAGCDGPETSNTATVTVTVNPVNDIPAAPDASRTTDEDVPLAVDLGALGADVETADADLAFGVTQPAHGTVTGAGGSRTYTPSADFNGTDSFTYTVTDRGDPDSCGAPGPACDDPASATGTITVTVGAVNDAPVNTVPVSVRAVLDAGTPSVTDWTAQVTGISIADVDSGGNPEKVTVQVVSGALTVRTDVAGGITPSSIVSGNGTDTVVIVAALADVNTTFAAADGIGYTVDPAPAAADTFTITTDDLGNSGSGGPQSDSDNFRILFNEPPVVTTTAGSAMFTEGGAAVAVDPGVTVTDADDTDLVAATVNVSAGLQAGDVLAFSDQNGITGSYNQGTGVLTLTGSTSVANYQTALRSVTFATGTDDPTLGRIVRFVVDDGAATSASATRGITITPVNDAPIVTPSAATPSYTENGAAVVVDAGMTVTDPDDITIESAQVRISANFQPGDTLAFTNQNGITGSYNSGTGVLTLTGPAAIASYQTALRAVTFSSTQDAPTATKTIQFTVNDGTADSNQAAKTVTINSVNDAPVVDTSAGTTANTENALSVVDNAATVTDVDDTTLNSAVVAITAGRQTGDELQFTDQNGITGSYNSGTGVLTLTGSSSVANYQTALRTVQFRTANDNPTTTRTIGFTVNDGDTDSNTDTKAITITPVNDAPTVTTTGTALAYIENQAATAIDPGVTVTDPDSTQLTGATVAVTTGFTGAQDDLAFTNQNGITGTYNDTTGVLTLTGTTTIANYVTALQSVTYVNVSDNPTPATRQITFQVTDSAAATSNTATRTINITAVNDPPVNTVPGGQTVNEDTTLTFNAANLITVADVDAGTNPVQVTVSAANGTITPATGSGATITGSGTATAQITGTLSQVNAALNGLTYRGNPNYNVTRGVETITVVTNDQGNTGTGGARTDSDTIAVTVNAVNDAPTAPAQSFNVQTNMRRTISVALTGAGGPTDPDTGDGNYTATFTLASVTLPATGCTGCVLENVNLAAGTFDFEPPAGQTGAFTVNYTVTDSGNPTPGLTSATGTLTMNVAGDVIWFVNPSAAANGTGTLAHPFQALSGVAGTPNDADDVDAANHRIFVYSNGTAAGALTLNTGEWLIGQAANPGSNFDTFFNLGTVPPGTIARPPLNTGTTTLGGTITLATDTRVQGVTISTGANTALTGTGGLTGVNVIQTALTTTTGTALSLNNVAGTITLADLDKNGTGTGISLTNVAAGVTIPAASSIANTTTAAIDIDTGTGAFSYAGVINNSTSGGRTIEVTNRNTGTPGLVQFTGTINGGGTGVNLDNNDNGTITFTGGLALSTGTNTAFNAINGGTVNVTGATNNITTTNATALSVTGTTIGASGLNFLSINVDGNDSAPTNGIVLSNTGTSAGLTVSGNGTAGSGGTIQDTSGDGVQLTTTEMVSLSYMNITSNLGDGIGGSGVNGFVLANDSITLNGNDAASDESGINLTEVTGTANGGARPTTITNSTISNNNEFELQIRNTSGTLADFRMSGNTLSSNGLPINGNVTSPHGNLVNFLGGSTSVMTLTVTSGTFTGNWNPASPPATITATAIGAVNQGTAHTVNVSGATFTNNNVGVDVSSDPINTTLTFNIHDNTFVGSRAVAINSFQNGNPPFARTVNGRIENNTIGTLGVAGSGSNLGNGISIQNEGAVPVNVLISGNTIQEVAQFPGISSNVGLSGIATGAQTTNLTITNNIIRNIGSRGIALQENQSNPAQTPGPFLCANVSGNTFSGIAGQAGNGEFMRFRELNGTVTVTQATPTAAATPGEVDDANGFNDPTKINISGGVAFSQPACPTPP